jgi:uncharacterized protein (UPF0264 family)
MNQAMRNFNRKLLVSVFNAQEAREAVLGGARIVDSEDPKSALGNIKPRQIMAVSDSVLDFKRDLEVQLSTNIGEDQLLFRRSPDGQAIEKSPYEIAGKASQAAIGVACSMGTRVHPCNLVKVGVDGMEVEKLVEVLSEVVLTLQRTEQFSHSQVMSVLFARNLAYWNERKKLDAVRSVLVGLREFYSAPEGGNDAFDLTNYAVGTLRNAQGSILFTDKGQVSLGTLIQNGVLPNGSNDTLIRVNPLFDQKQFFPRLASGDSTNRSVIKAMVDATAEAGANAIMIDTSILTKVCNICLVDTSGSGMVDINRFRQVSGMQQKGILKLDDLQFFVDYCHFRGVEANVAGSVESYQAQQLWVLIPELDQASTRGAASGVDIDPFDKNNVGENTRQYRVIKRTLVRGIAPPEHGGVLNLPVELQAAKESKEACDELRRKIVEGRRRLGLPELHTYYVNADGTIGAYVDAEGNTVPYEKSGWSH